MSKQKKPKAPHRALLLRLFGIFLRQLGLWTLLVVGVLLLLSLLLYLLYAMDFQWLYNLSPRIYYPLRDLVEWLSSSTAPLILGAVLWLAGLLVLVYRALRRAVSYLELLSRATGTLTDPAAPGPELPAELGEFELQLGRIRQEALTNARQAREAEQRKNDLVVYLAHDLKTPLTSVIGYLTLLRDEPQLSPALRARYTGIALDKAQRLEELVNELFEITRFNLTHLELEPQRISLTRLLEQTTSEFLPLLEEKGLFWQLELPRDVSIVCDPGKLERVFDNLIRNALAYSYRDSPISLTLEQEGEEVRIRITNRGKTIGPEKLSRIFQQFFRADPARSTATGGTGIGLAVAKELVELHGGRISAQSREETICFTVELPENCQKIV